MNKPLPADRDLLEHAYSAEVERCALAIVLDGRHLEAWDTLISVIGTPIAFYVTLHQHIALACVDLATAGHRIDGSTVAEHLSHTSHAEQCERLAELSGQPKGRRKGDAVSYDDSVLANVGGFNVIHEVAMTFAPVLSLKRHAEIIAEHYRQRQAIAAFSAAVDALRAPQGVRQVAKIVDIAVTKTLARDGGTSEGTIGEGVRAAMAQHDAMANGTAKVRSACWGLAALDEKCELTAGSVTTVAGVTGGGKTSLVLGAVEATAAKYGPGSVLKASLEMTRKELGAILLARKLRVTRRMIDHGQLRPEVRAMADDHQAYFDSLGVIIRDRAERNTAADIKAWAMQRQRISGGAVVLLVVDHVGLVSRPPRASSLDAISDAYRELKAFAMSSGIACILLNQYNRDGAKAERGRDGITKADPKPRLQDLKLAGEADSDNVVMLWRPNLNSGPRQDRVAVIAKCRSGPICDVPLVFEPALGQRFFDPLDETPRANGHKPSTKMFTDPQPGEGAVFDAEGNQL